MPESVMTKRHMLIVWGIFACVMLWTAPGLDYYLGNSDHGYQLSMGKEMLLGKFPFVDLFFHYGPLTALTSAFGLWLSNSLIPETVICALGYATALALIYFLTRFYLSTMAGILSSCLGFFLLSRFYKWYYWLFPLLVLYSFHVLLQTQSRRRGLWLFMAGIIAGVGGLYRLDLGVVFLCFYSLCLFGICLKPLNVKQMGRHHAILFSGFLLPLFVWCLFLWGNGGSTRDFFNAVFAGSQGVVTKLSLPIPKFDLWHPFSLRSSSALAFVLTPLTYIFCLFFGLWRWSHTCESLQPKWAFMIAVGLMGLGIFPQALHRSDVSHLLQVLPPALIAGSLMISELWHVEVSSKRPHLKKFSIMAFVVLYLLLVGTSAWGIRRYGGINLVKWELNPIPRYQKLKAGNILGSNHPVARIVNIVHQNSEKGDSILAILRDSQLYYFIDRPLNGLVNVYAPGVLDNAEWRLRNLEAIRNDPPVLVIAMDIFFDLPPTNSFREYQPELYDFLYTHYSRIIYRQDKYLLLAANETASP